MYSRTRTNIRHTRTIRCSCITYPVFHRGFSRNNYDAYISGVPVVVTRWKYASEFVNHGNSGFLFDLDKEEDFYIYVDRLYNDRSQLLKMKHGAYEKSKEYSSESAWQILKQYLVI